MKVFLWISIFLSNSLIMNPLSWGCMTENGVFVPCDLSPNCSYQIHLLSEPILMQKVESDFPWEDETSSFEVQVFDRSNLGRSNLRRSVQVIQGDEFYQAKRSVGADLGYVRALANLQYSPQAGEISQNWTRHDQLTLGDLHGNTMKLIYFLIREGVMKLSEPGDYEELYGIYQKSGLIINLNKSKTIVGVDILGIRQFDKIIKNAVFSQRTTLIRLIGDELADRGHNDFFTFLVLDRMQKEKVNFEIILSNHGLEFIRFYETILSKRKNVKEFNFNLSSENHGRSLQNLIHVLSFEPEIYLKKTMDIIATAYLPHLKLISYSNNRQGQISFYSHAPVGLEAIVALASSETMGFEGPPDWIVSRHGLIESINKINEKFMSIRSSGLISSVINLETLNQVRAEKVTPNDSVSGADSASFAPMTYIAWNRDYTLVVRPPQLLDGTEMKYVHGHDSTKEYENYFINLDNTLGKGDHFYDYKGEYTYYHSTTEATDVNFEAGLVDSESMDLK